MDNLYLKVCSLKNAKDIITNSSILYGILLENDYTKDSANQILKAQEKGIILAIQNFIPTDTIRKIRKYAENITDVYELEEILNVKIPLISKKGINSIENKYIYFTIVKDDNFIKIFTTINNITTDVDEVIEFVDNVKRYKEEISKDTFLSKKILYNKLFKTTFPILYPNFYKSLDEIQMKDLFSLLEVYEYENSYIEGLHAKIIKDYIKENKELTYYYLNILNKFLVEKRLYKFSKNE